MYHNGSGKNREVVRKLSFQTKATKWVIYSFLGSSSTFLLPKVHTKATKMGNLFLFGFFLDLLVAQERQKHVVSNLDSVDVKQALRWWDEREIDRMGRDPDSPRSHNSSLQISLKLFRVIVERLAFGKVQIAKEHETKDRVPEQLIDRNFASNSRHGGTWQFAVQKAIKVVTGRSVDQETERA
jgi:hypothetical protein